MQQGPYNHDPYNYDSYDAPKSRGLPEKIFGAKIGSKLRSPLFATIALVAVAGIFAAVIAGSYSSAKQGDGQVPIVRADATDYKAAPETPGGMEVPYKDSTVFDTARQNAAPGAQPGIENLLASNEDSAAPAMSKADAISAAPQSAPPAVQGKVPAEIAANEAALDAPDQSKLEAPKGPAGTETASADMPPQPEAKSPSEVTIKQEIQKISPQELAKPQNAPVRPETLHAAGDSPETLAFVRSVLKEKDAQGQSPAAAPAAVAPPATTIEPAAGAATPATASPGGYFVQVSSVPAAAAAPVEWAKLQKTFVSLQGQQYRVQEAAVTGKGTMYRIQAGPLPKDKAASLCESIKAQKPGGCLVVH